MSVPWAPAPIPRQTNRLHLGGRPLEWLGDSPRAAKRAGRKGNRGGSPYTDTNLQALIDGAVATHSGTPKAGGWRYITIGKGRRRALTHAELVKPFHLWHKADVVRLRLTRRAGLSYRSRVRPYLFGESVAQHKAAGAVPCYELKTGFSHAQAVAMVNAANAAQQTVYFMTLAHQQMGKPKPGADMSVAGEKLKTFKLAGGQTALLTHGYSVPPDIKTWAPYIDAYWGANSEVFRKAAKA